MYIQQIQLQYQLQKQIQQFHMNKLRGLYEETQKNAKQYFDRVTQQRMKKVLAFTNRQYQTILAKNNYTNLEEVTFYRQKFQMVVNTIKQAQQKGYKKQKVQEEFIKILKQNYVPPQFQSRPNPYVQQQHVNQPIQNVQPIAPSQVIKSYFDTKKQQIQKSKVGFKSVIQDIPFVPKKFPVKSSAKRLNDSQVKHIVQPNKDLQIKALKDEIARLKNELDDKESQKQFRFGLLEIEKKEYQQRIKELNNKLKHIQAENATLKEQSARNYQINPQPYIVHKQVIEDQQNLYNPYNPYQIKFRQNDINKINNKLTKPKTTSINNENPVYGINNLMKQLDKRQDQKYQINEQKRKNSLSVLNASNIKSNLSGVKEEENHIALRSKISFFKSSMILYKGEQFEIAVRSFDQIRLQKKKIILYVNNRTNMKQVIKVHYKFDPQYYQLVLKKKLNSIDGLTQGKQQVEVSLVNKVDLDSLIEVQMTVNTKNIVFLLPVMFIQFLEKRPELEDQSKYQTQRILPIHQFSSLHSAAEFMPIQKLFGQYEQNGRVYAVSKNHQGYIYLKWLGGQVQIRTINAWKLFFGYLLLKQY